MTAYLAPLFCVAMFTSAGRRGRPKRCWSKRWAATTAGAVTAGSIGELTEQLRSFGELGYTDILVRHLTGDQPKALGSLERLAAVRAAPA
jgi:hypothetical protein